VTLDAMGCQKEIAQQIIDQKGDYILRVKANQGGLLEAVETTFQQADGKNYHNMIYHIAKDEINNDHGRLESRICFVLPAMYLIGKKIKWKGIKSIILLISEREIGSEKTVEYRYYVSSLEPQEAEKIVKAIRSYWQIENNLHWVLDVAYREDQSRIRDENTALNMSWLRKTALGFLKQTPQLKGSIRRKQLALWAKPQHLLDIIKF
jgi:predicted transposase YbfD/YdcC